MNDVENEFFRKADPRAMAADMAKKNAAEEAVRRQQAAEAKEAEESKERERLAKLKEWKRQLAIERENNPAEILKDIRRILNWFWWILIGIPLMLIAGYLLACMAAGVMYRLGLFY